MDEQPYTPSPVHEHGPTYSPFWPIFLIGLSLIMILCWEIWVGVAARKSAQDLQEQQVKMVEQAKQVQAGLEKLVRGLVELGKTDEAAQRLVTKFGIKISEPGAPTPTPSP